MTTTTTTTTDTFHDLRDAIRAWAAAASTNGAFVPEALYARAEDLPPWWSARASVLDVLALLAEARSDADARHEDAWSGCGSTGPRPAGPHVVTEAVTIRLVWPTSVSTELALACPLDRFGRQLLNWPIVSSWVEIHGDHEQRTDALRRVCRPLGVDVDTVTTTAQSPDIEPADPVTITNPSDIDV